jgi:membrane protease YdiL (CAAX protease family)
MVILKEYTMAVEWHGTKTKSPEFRNLVFFFLIVFGLQGLRYGLQMEGILQVSGPGMLLVSLASWGPLIAAFTVTGLTEGKAGVKALWRRFWNRNLTVRWLLVAVLIIPAVSLGANLLARLLDRQAYPLFVAYDPLWTILTVFLSAFIGSGMAEEFGWRGYVLPRLQSRWNALTSSLVLGVIWALWHAGQWFIPGSNLYGRNAWLWGSGMLLLSIIITWVFNHTKGSVLGAALIHAMWNTGIFNYPSLERFYGVLLLAVILIVAIFGARDLVRYKSEKGA